eukprot:gene22031-29093_t
MEDSSYSQQQSRLATEGRLHKRRKTEHVEQRSNTSLMSSARGPPAGPKAPKLLPSPQMAATLSAAHAKAMASALRVGATPPPPPHILLDIPLDALLAQVPLEGDGQHRGHEETMEADYSSSGSSGAPKHHGQDALPEQL